MTHIETAARDGMKAGFKQYVRTLVRSNLPTVVALRSDLEKMGKRQAFAWYCAQHGPDVTALQASQRNRPRTVKVADMDAVGVQVFADEPVGLAEEILAARQRLAELEAQIVEDKPARKPATRKSASKVKENTWHPWAVSKYGIPTKVGGTFVYRSKKRGTSYTHKVVRVTKDGSVVTARVA